MTHHQPLSVSIIYGFNEGPYMGRRLRRDLVAAGFAMANDPADADIVIMHSGGCFMPPLSRRKNHRVIMIGLPYYPGRSIFGSLMRKVWTDMHLHHREGELRFWLRKTIWNARYFWRMPANIAMLRGWRKGAHWRLHNVSVIRYHEDPFITPDTTSLPFRHPIRVIELPGHHDDCWRRPAAVVQAIQTIVQS